MEERRPAAEDVLGAARPLVRRRVERLRGDVGPVRVERLEQRRIVDRRGEDIRARELP